MQTIVYFVTHSLTSCLRFQFYEQVEKEDYDLCVATQRNLNTGVYSHGHRESAMYVTIWLQTESL